MKKEDGGQAFPRAGSGTYIAPVEGMSLRDWFAGQALQGLIVINSGGFLPDVISKDAFNIADAMIEARGTE